VIEESLWWEEEKKVFVQIFFSENSILSDFVDNFDKKLKDT